MNENEQAASTNQDGSQSSGQQAERPSLVESSEMVQRSADQERIRLTERSDVRYFQRDQRGKDTRKKG